jgi:L-ascorbate metabolism protein UlaG (beta-lactamase superfamily)
MKIKWYGHSFFELTAKPTKKEKIRIVIDPYDKKIGINPPKIKRADALLVSHDHYDHSNTEAVKGKPFLIDGPGEYEIKKVYIKGVPAFHDQSSGKERGKVTIFVIEMADLTICHLSDFGQKELTEDQLEKIGEVNILMVPIGGNFTIGAKAAANVINQIEPQIVIPMHYKIPGVKIDIDGIDKFLKVMGIQNPEKEKFLSVKKKDLPESETKVIVLEKL